MTQSALVAFATRQIRDGGLAADELAAAERILVMDHELNGALRENFELRQRMRLYERAIAPFAAEALGPEELDQLVLKLHSLAKSNGLVPPPREHAA